MRTRLARHTLQNSYSYRMGLLRHIMSEEIKARKEMMRAEAIRTRGLLSLSSADLEALTTQFFSHIPLKEGQTVGAYWPKDRELDTRPLIDEIILRGYKIALPVAAKDSCVLQFVRWHEEIDLVEGRFGILHPVINEDTEFLEPDVLIIPMLAFDRKGRRLGYGGGYYDATIADLRIKRTILAVGIAYAEQACLFQLPEEDHDIPMNYIITPQQVMRF